MSFKSSRTLATAAFTALALVSVAIGQEIQNPRPRFVTLPQHPQVVVPAPAANLIQWNGSFKDLKGVVRTFTMVGTNPATTNKTSTITVFLIPIKMIYNAGGENIAFDPNKDKFSNGKTITNTILASPIFQSNVDFKQGGTDLGKTQYIDAFQRGNFWGKSVKKNTSYHVLLKPTLLAEQTITCNTFDCAVGSPFGVTTVGMMDIFNFDSHLQAFMTKLTQVQPNTLAIFLTHNIYLTESGNCCIGGYHSANGSQPGGQTYSYTTSVDQGVGVFSQDTAAMSHEIGEWLDDPFVDNAVGCTDNSILEVGDPLVLDDHPYTVNGFTYHLQDLVFLGYFGAPGSTSLHNWLSFQNDKKTVCPGQ
jgi:hypothetical protein